MTKKEKIEKVNETVEKVNETVEKVNETVETVETNNNDNNDNNNDNNDNNNNDNNDNNDNNNNNDDTDLLYKSGNGDGLISEKLTNLTNSISLLKEVQKRSDYGIAYALNLINKHHKEEIKELGYKNVEDYANSKFDYSKSTFHNYIKIAERFINPKVELRKAISSNCFGITSIMSKNSFTVLEDIDGYPFTISQMLELLPLSDEQIQEHLEEFSAGDTTKTIRNKVNAIRAGIETTATEAGAEGAGAEGAGAEGAGAEGAGAEGAGAEGAGAGAGAGAGNAPADDTSRILAILEIVNKLENEEIRNKLVEAINSVINS